MLKIETGQDNKKTETRSFQNLRFNASESHFYGPNVRACYAVQHLKSFTVKPAGSPLHTADAVYLLSEQKTIEARPHDLVIESSSNEFDLVVRDVWNNKVLSCTAKELVEDMLLAGMKPNYSVPRKPFEQRTGSITSEPITPDYTVRQDSHIVAPGHDVDIFSEDELYSNELDSKWIRAERLLLNYCLDDIENGMLVLRERAHWSKTKHLATSSKQSKRTRGYSGILIDQVDVDPDFAETAQDFFEKVKFAIILLSRLDGSWPQLKAPVLCRQLFHLLSECVTFWKTEKTRSAFFPSKVEDPAFPTHTLVFLQAHLTLDQTELLQDLGPAWSVARENKLQRAPYVPKFASGFTVEPDNYDGSLFSSNQTTVNAPRNKRDDGSER